jgi:hypothetical protein
MQEQIWRSVLIPLLNSTIKILTKLLLRTRLGMMGYFANFHSQPMNTNQSTAPTQYIAMIEASSVNFVSPDRIEGKETYG